MLSFNSFLAYDRLRRRLRRLRYRWQGKSRPSPYGWDKLPWLAPRPLPRRIWLYWAQGIENAPDVAQACIASWRRHHPDWEIEVLSEANIGDFVDTSGIPDGLIHAHRADFLRLRLLKRHGGVWADATCYCNRPLEHWLPHLLTGGFFAFSQPTPDRLICNWFLASEPEGRIVTDWLAGMQAYWTRRSTPHDYFWPMDVFAWQAAHNPQFRAAWQATPRISMDGTHYIQRQLVRGADPAQPDPGLDISAVPVFKLTWRKDFCREDYERWGIQFEETKAKKGASAAA